MRPRYNHQPQFRFQAAPTLKITERYYGKYDRIDAILKEHSVLVDLIHRDIAEPLDCEKSPDTTGEDCYKCSSETVLRIVICQIIEGGSLREIVVRIDDSEFLRQFVHIYNDSMIDYSTFCRLRNRITPETWKQINNTLAQTAVDQGRISGQRTRLDTTAVETNIHWPSDSSLLGDCYRTLARLVEWMRSLDPGLVDSRRLQCRKVKRLVQKIGRRSRGKARSATCETCATVGMIWKLCWSAFRNSLHDSMRRIRDCCKVSRSSVRNGQFMSGTPPIRQPMRSRGRSWIGLRSLYRGEGSGIGDSAA